MDRPSISVTSPMSPSMLRDAPQYLSGQLSVSDLGMTYKSTCESLWTALLECHVRVACDYTLEYIDICISCATKSRT